MRKIFRSNLFLLILILLQITSGIIIAPISKAYNLDIIQIFLIADAITLLIPMIIYFIITRQPVSRTLKLNMVNSKTLITSIFIGFLFIPIGSFCGVITSFWFPNNVGEVMAKANTANPLLFLIIFAVLPAIGEELAVRGIILSGYENVKLSKAALITGLFFAVLHLNPPQFLYTFVLGALLAYLVSYTNSIYPAMLVHFVFNGTSSLMFLLSDNVDAKQVEEASQNVGITTVIILFVLALVCFLLIVKLLRSLKEINNTEGPSFLYSSSTSKGLYFSSEKRDFHPTAFNIFVVSLPGIIAIAIFLGFVLLTR